MFIMLPTKGNGLGPGISSSDLVDLKTGEGEILKRGMENRNFLFILKTMNKIKHNST